MTPATIEEMCIKLKEQLTGTYIGKDNYTVSIPTKLEIAEEKLGYQLQNIPFVTS